MGFKESILESDKSDRGCLEPNQASLLIRQLPVMCGNGIPFDNINELSASILSYFPKTIPSCCVDFPALAKFAEMHQQTDVKNWLTDLSSRGRLIILGPDDMSDMSHQPLVIKAAASLFGKRAWPHLDTLLHAGGKLVFTVFTEPSATYLDAIRDQGKKTPSQPSDHNAHNIPMADRVDMALYRPTPEIVHASHQFISASILPCESMTPSQLRDCQNLTEMLNRRIDRLIEPGYARLVLLQKLLQKDMEGAMIGMLSIGAAIPPLILLDHYAQNHPILEALIKFIPPVISDMVTFWSQLSPWLKGDSRTEKMKDFIHTLCGSHRNSLALSLAATAVGSGLAEGVADEFGNVAGASIYSGIPLFVAIATTIQTARKLQAQMPGKSLMEVIRVMFANNPAHLGIDIGALATFVTGVGILGYGDQLHNPVALGLIEGAEEHTLAALITAAQLFVVQQRSFNNDLNRIIDRRNGRNWTQNPI